MTFQFIQLLIMLWEKGIAGSIPANLPFKRVKLLKISLALFVIPTLSRQ